MARDLASRTSHLPTLTPACPIRLHRPAPGSPRADVRPTRSNHRSRGSAGHPHQRRFGRSSGSGDERDDDVCGVTIEVLSSPVEIVVVRGSAWRAASWTSRSGTPASSAAMMNAPRSMCG